MSLVNSLIRRFVALDPDRQRRFTGQFGCIHAAASHAVWNELDGAYLEFGVWKGESFTEAFHSFAYHTRQRQLTMDGMRIADQASNLRSRRFVAFDSFEGLPASAEVPHGDYSAGSYACSEAAFLERLQRDGVDTTSVETVAGYYDATLRPDIVSKLSLGSAAVVLIDCDLYESTVPVLDFITPLLVQGSIIIFDDWFRHHGSRTQGERRACSEWLARNPQITLEDWWQDGPQCKAFLVHR